MPAPERLILYARVSTPAQAKKTSLDYQVAQMEDYAKSIGAEVVERIRDDQSGRTMERDGLQEALRMLRANEADGLVTWKIDRLHRKYINFAIARDTIQQLGKDIHYADTRTKSGKTALERFPENMRAHWAEIEAETILERTTQGREDKARLRGKWVGLGRPPFGYAKKGRGEDAALVIDEETAKIVRLIYELYVFGDGSSGPLSTLEVARRLTAMGEPTPTERLDKNYAANRTRPRGEWSRATIQKILRHEAYSGLFYQNKYQSIDRKKNKNGKEVSIIRLNPDRSDWIAVTVPAIVDKALWGAAQAKLDKGRELPARLSNPKNEYLVAGHIFCSCGYRLRASTTKVERNGVQHEYPYYCCPGKKGIAARRCDYKRQPTGKIDDKVWEWVKAELGNPDAVERKMREQQEAQRGTSSAQQEALASIYQHKAEIESNLERYAILFAQNTVPERILNDLIAVKRRELELTEAEQARVEAELVTPITEERIQTVRGWSEDLQQRLGNLERTFKGRRTVIEGLNVQATVVRQDDGSYGLKLRSDLRPESPEDDLVSLSNPSTTPCDIDTAVWYKGS